MYEPLKKYTNTATDAWVVNYSGQTMAICDIPGIVKASWPLTATLNITISGFSSTGILSFNRDIFSDSNFASSCVTERPEPNATNISADSPNPSHTPSATPGPNHAHFTTPVLSHVLLATTGPSHAPRATPSPSHVTPATPDWTHVASATPCPTCDHPVMPPTPEQIRPFPKVGPRKESTTYKRKKKRVSYSH